MLDLDGGDVGEASLFQFQLDEGFLPETREHKSGRGGRHLIFSDPHTQAAQQRVEAGAKARYPWRQRVHRHPAKHL
jgi:hypothetical protein